MQSEEEEEEEVNGVCAAEGPLLLLLLLCSMPGNASGPLDTDEASMSLRLAV